jgi:hypothetical protein
MRAESLVRYPLHLRQTGRSVETALYSLVYGTERRSRMGLSLEELSWILRLLSSMRWNIK